MARGRKRFFVALVASALLASVALSAAHVSAAAKSKLKVFATVPASVREHRALRVTGHLSRDEQDVRALLEQKTGGKWHTRTKTNVSGGKFALSWTAPRKGGAILLRVVTARHGHQLATTSVKHVLVTAPVATVKPTTVTSAPQTGRPGTVIVHGLSSARPGEFLATGVGPQTPYGFLAKVTSVKQSGGDTLLGTQPTSLLDAVPEGAIDTNVSTTTPTRFKGRGAPRAAKQDVDRLVSCTGGGSIAVKGSVSVSPSVTFKAHWHWDWRLTRSGVDAATLTGNVTANADLVATAQAAASCSLRKTKIAQIDLAPVEVQVGPVPVVLVPKILVYVSADGSVSSTVSTGVHGSLSATAGVKYDKGDFSPIGSASANWNYDEPSIDTSAELQGTITPAFQLLLYGVAGPQLDFSAGLKLSADTQSDPWWTLTAPVDLTARLTAPLLGLDSGTLHVYHNDFFLAQARKPPPPPPATETQRASISWNTDGTDVDLHVWNENGDHAWYSDKTAIPNATLSEDITTGFGPEEFAVSSAPSTETLIYGLCYFNDNDVGATNVSVHLTDPDGSGRDLSYTLGATGDSVLIGSSPAGSGFTPPDGWCGS